LTLFYKNLGLCSKVAGITCIFMNERHGALAGHSPPRCGAVPKVIWADLLLFAL